MLEGVSGVSDWLKSLRRRWWCGWQIVHPALQVTVAGSQRQGASTVQPVNSLPRSAFQFDGAADHDSGDDPTSPVVTCIGQVPYLHLPPALQPKLSQEPIWP